MSLPLAIEVSHISPNHRLILSNGLLNPKVGLIRWILPRLQQIPCTLKRQLLRPSFCLPAMASSVAFRRLVINPYVMNRTTLDDLTKKLLSDSNYRKNVSEYLTSLESWKLRCPENTNVYGVWGDNDLLFPVEQIAAERMKLSTLAEQSPFLEVHTFIRLNALGVLLMRSTKSSSNHNQQSDIYVILY